MRGCGTGELGGLSARHVAALLAATLAGLALVGSVAAAPPTPDPSPSGGGGPPQPDAYGAAPAPAPPAVRRSTQTTRVTTAVGRPTIVATSSTPPASALVPPTTPTRTPRVKIAKPHLIRTTTPRSADVLALSLPRVRPGDVVAPATDRRALFLAALALVTLVAASGGFLALAFRYRRDLERA